MKENRPGLDQPREDGTADPLGANRRSVDEARRAAKKWLWFATLLLVLLALIGLVLGDWISVAILGVGLGILVKHLVGELREPRGREPRDQDQRVQVQNLLDDLRPRAMWLGRDEYRVAKWIGVLAGAFWLMSAVLMLVARESLLGAIAPFLMASLFGAGAVWSDRAESRRREAIELLEGMGEDHLV